MIPLNYIVNEKVTKQNCYLTYTPRGIMMGKDKCNEEDGRIWNMM